MFKPVRNFLQNTVRRRGSALLIVLGFLSFMVISGVSFAIYMRIEHQAAANYRHNVTARHLLNAGLARAMEEIDAELRVRRDYKVRWNGDPASSEPVQVKFPQWKDWPGRVKVSAVPEINNNNEDARVLSLEALSYLPAVLVNDVRRFARRQEGSNKDPEYMGAKWRQLERSIDGDLIGRYAYVCVNVSDMFDLNRMRAAQPLDSSTNRVSIGHSFLSQAEREKYDEYAAMDRMYLSMQDFYTARYDHDRSYKSSPYHEYLDTGAPGLAWFGKTPTDKQTFISDTLVKAEPVRKDAFALNAEDDPNLTRIFSNPNFMSTKDVGTLQNIADLTNPFWEALSRVPADGRMDPANDKRKIMALMIKDYLDKDNIPSVLTVPTTEMVPMVSQIVIEQDKWAPQIVQKSETGGSPARTVNTLYLQLFGPRTTSPAPANYPAGIQMIAPIYVELAFPFKYAQHRQYKPKFELEVEAYLYIAKDGNPKDSRSFMTMPTQAQGYYKLKQGVPNVKDPWAKQIVTEDDAFLDCNAVLEPDGWDGAVKIVETYSDGSPPSWQAPFTAGQQFTVSLIVFARVKCDNDYVDSAPQFAPAPRALGMSAENEFMMSPKLFFQSLPMTANDGMTAGPFNYEWTSIEVADPRFNHNASNWVRSDKVPGSTDQTPSKHIGVNRSTRNILGKDGRDNDIFMSVADTGYFQSPGELGFIVRSYSTLGVPSTAPWNLREATEGDEEKHMFRTFRLYDHSTGSTENNKRDFIYNNFTTAQPDSFLTGARINPLSDFDHVLESAIWNTPLDYYLASSNNQYRISGSTTDLKTLLEQGTCNHYIFFNGTAIGNPDGNSNWKELVDGWSDSLIKAVSQDVPGRILDNSGNPGNYTFRVDRDWRSNLSDVYGEWDNFKWYAQSDDKSDIFNKTLSLTRKMHEVDRKILYSYSLDSFSDRQQLFLYFIRAETALPALGMGSGSGSRSLAGGRAVALVWRDPYPRGYDKARASGARNENISNGPWDKKDGSGGWYQRLNDVVSPWVQYYTTPGSGQDVQASEDPRYSGGYRWNGWHDTRVLFFKQLDK